MKATTATGLWSVALAFLLVRSDAAAQTPVQSFADLQPLLKPGQNVIVTDDKGVKTSGQVASILGSQLEINQSRLRYVFSEDSVRRIQDDDGIWNGALIGLGIGAVLAPLAHARCSAPGVFDETCGLEYAYMPLLGSLFGAGIDGWLHRSLYFSPDKSTISIVPLLGHARIGLAATIRFQGHGR